MRSSLSALQDTEVSLAPVSRSNLLQKQMPGLDVLRGLAVLAVVCYHGLCWGLPLHTFMTLGTRRLVSLNSPGWIGVNLFFVLSGFLITGILLDTKSKSTYWKSFYVRRVLRILPLYLVVLVLAKIYFGIRLGYVILCLLYAANLVAYFPNIGPTHTVLWSLAVEEQFYLLWPLLIRRNSTRVLIGLCVALIVICPILRGLSAGSYPWLGDPYTATWLISDNLAWGALVALLLRSSKATTRNVAIATMGLALGGTLLMAALAHFQLLSRKQPLGAALQVVPFLALFTVLLILALRYGNRVQVLRWSAPFRFFGYISYGFYLLHNFFFVSFDIVASHLRTPPALLTAPALLFRFFTVLVICSFACFLSRRYFEASFLRLKDRLVPYSQGEQNRHKTS